MTRKTNQPALPPVLPLVAVPYVSPGQISKIRATYDVWDTSLVDEAVVDLFAADTVAGQYAALDELRSLVLAWIDERPVDDPRGAVAAPPTDQADDGETAGPMVVFAGMTALEAFDGIAGALGFVRIAAADAAAVCERCHAPARDMCACDGDAVEGTGGAT